MNIVNSFKKPIMILTFLLAISCSISPLKQGQPKHFLPDLTQQEVTPVLAQPDTPKVQPVKGPTPAQIEMRKQINKAFSSIEDISKATGDISMSQKELVRINKSLVGGLLKLQSNYDSLRTDNRAVKGALISTQASSRLQSEKITQLIQKGDEDRRTANAFRNMITKTLYLIIPYCIIGFVVLAAFAALKWKENRVRRLGNLVNYGG